MSALFIAVGVLKVTVHDVGDCRCCMDRGALLIAYVYHYACGTLSETMTKIDDLHMAGYCRSHC